MPTLRQLVSGYELLLERLKLSKDTRFTREWINYQIKNYRAIGIRETYKRNTEIESVWLQDFGRIPISEVNSGDDPLINFTSIKFGKWTMPPVVSLPDDLGVYRISGSSKIERYYPIKFDNWFRIPDDSPQKKFKYYMLELNSLYITPCCTEINPTLILYEPMDGYRILTEKIQQDQLEVGQSYTVYDFQIVHNSIAHNPGSAFTAVNGNYSGNGYVKFSNMKRRMTIDDEYPMGANMIEYITRMIFSIELKMDSQLVVDTINDSKDPIETLQKKG